jgi:Ser-tRNA(Ala) deacylase AlaX
VAWSIDWERSYLFMRGYAVCHLLSAVIYRETGAMITGNQIGEDRSSVDLQACGGTHVGRTGNIGSIKMLKAENKGRANRRVYFEVLGGD